MRFKVVLSIVLLSCVATASAAPYIFENITSVNRFKLKTNFYYSNQTTRSVVDQGYSTISLDNGKTLYLANPVLEGQTNSDRGVLSLNLNYGLNDKWDLGLTTTGLASHARYSDQEVIFSKSQLYFQDVNFDTQYQLFEKHAYMPDTLLFGSVTLYDAAPRYKAQAFNSFVAGASVYTVNDPVILTLNTSYQYNLPSQTLQGKTYQSGDVLAVSGSLGFAVNPDISLNTGFSWNLRMSDYQDKVQVNPVYTQTNLNLGFAYAITDRYSLSFNLRTNVSGASGSTISIGLTSKLGELPPPHSERYRKNKAAGA